jgi:hypothetical protein
MSKRELIEPHPGDKRYVRRDSEGQFTKDQVDLGKSLVADRRTKSKTMAPKGQGDRGDQKTWKGRFPICISRRRRRDEKNHLGQAVSVPTRTA